MRKCKNKNCSNAATREDQVYCSADCAPYGHLIEIKHQHKIRKPPKIAFDPSKETPRIEKKRKAPMMFRKRPTPSVSK